VQGCGCENCWDSCRPAECGRAEAELGVVVECGYRVRVSCSEPRPPASSVWTPTHITPSGPRRATCGSEASGRTHLMRVGARRAKDTSARGTGWIGAHSASRSALAPREEGVRADGRGGDVRDRRARISSRSAVYPTDETSTPPPCHGPRRSLHRTQTVGGASVTPPRTRAACPLCRTSAFGAGAHAHLVTALTCLSRTAAAHADLMERRRGRGRG
jgi:hypothetical protein